MTLSGRCSAKNSKDLVETDNFLQVVDQNGQRVWREEERRGAWVREGMGEWVEVLYHGTRRYFCQVQGTSLCQAVTGSRFSSRYLDTWIPEYLDTALPGTTLV